MTKYIQTAHDTDSASRTLRTNTWVNNDCEKQNDSCTVRRCLGFGNHGIYFLRASGCCGAKGAGPAWCVLIYIHRYIYICIYICTYIYIYIYIMYPRSPVWVCPKIGSSLDGFQVKGKQSVAFFPQPHFNMRRNCGPAIDLKVKLFHFAQCAIVLPEAVHFA